MAAWKLIYEIVKNLGGGWEVEASGPQEMGFSCGLASGPSGMRLFFIGERTEKLDPRIERTCPSQGWLRVDGRIPLADEDLDARISVMLRGSLTAEEMANNIKLRLLPLYVGFLGVVEKHQRAKRENTGLRSTELGLAYINSSAYALQMVAMVAQFWVPDKSFYELLVATTAMQLSESDPAAAGPAAFKRFIADNLPTIRAAIDRIKESQPAIKLSEEDWERAEQ